MSFLLLGPKGELLQIVDGSFHQATHDVLLEHPDWDIVYDGDAQDLEESSARKENPTRLPLIHQQRDLLEEFSHNDLTLLRRVKESMGLTRIDPDRVNFFLKDTKSDERQKEAMILLRPWLPNGSGFDNFSSAARHLLSENYKTGKAAQGVSCWNPWTSSMQNIPPSMSRGLNLVPAFGLSGGLFPQNGAQHRMMVAQAQGHPYLQARGNAPAWRPLNLKELIPSSKKMTLCPSATSHCISSCLVFSGQMDIGYGTTMLDGSRKEFAISRNMITKARKTEALLAEPEAFCALLIAAIQWHKDWCDKNRMKCFVRLNVLSDIPWEVIFPELLQGWGPDVIFYDYTKIPGRVTTSRWRESSGDRPYHLTYSFAGGKLSMHHSEMEIHRGVPTAFVFYLGSNNEFDRIESKKVSWSNSKRWQGLRFGDYPVYDGDCHDLRPYDPSQAILIGLQYKQPVKQHLRPDAKNSAFLVYAEKTEVKVGNSSLDGWLIPASGRQLNAELFLEMDQDSP